MSIANHASYHLNAEILIRNRRDELNFAEKAKLLRHVSECSECAELYRCALKSWRALEKRAAAPASGRMVYQAAAGTHRQSVASSDGWIRIAVTCHGTQPVFDYDSLDCGGNANMLALNPENGNTVLNDDGGLLCLTLEQDMLKAEVNCKENLFIRLLSDKDEDNDWDLIENGAICLPLPKHDFMLEILMV